jgi:predicted nucleic acid-binding protein
MLIIADSSALISLAVCEKLYLLEQLYGEVKVPKAVFSEVTQEDKQQAETLRSYLQNKVVDLDLTELLLDFGELGRGELEAMALFRKLRADLLLLDDKRARRVANLNEIPIVGSLGILLFAKRKGAITSVKPLIASLEASGIHIGKPLIQKILFLAGEEG